MSAAPKPSRCDSKPEEVAAYLRDLDHPKRDVVLATRKVVLAAARSIGEEIKWNSPTFFYTGPMPPTDPKAYARYLVNFNLFRKDCIRLVFLRAAGIPDPTALLEGTYADGRRIAILSSVEDVRHHADALRSILRAQLAGIRASPVLADGVEGAAPRAGGGPRLTRARRRVRARR